MRIQSSVRRVVRVLAATSLIAACNGSGSDAAGAVGPTTPTSTQADVTVRIDGAARHQTYEGFGATTASLTYNNGTKDNVSPTLRSQALDAAYSQVKLTLGSVGLADFETANDDDDPFTFNWSGFEIGGVSATVEKLIKPARARGADDLYPGNVVNTLDRAWLGDLRTTDYNRYLDEVAEYVAAGAVLWRDQTGVAPKYHALFNEPLTGNKELSGASISVLTDIVKRAGARLRREGLQTKFIIPSEETEQTSLDDAQAILADPDARQYVAAIGYHTYPYGSTYASVPRILATSGAGRPDAARVALRSQLRDLGTKFGVPVWMTEVSHGEVDPRQFDALLGRAIHIHDEMVYADASAYFGMNALWDSQSNREHFPSGTSLYNEEDTIVLIDNEQGKVLITGMGYAIGQYARWLTRGAVRVESQADNAQVLTVAFHDAAQQRLTLVVINSSDAPRTAAVDVTGLGTLGSIRGERSTSAARWQSIPAFTPESATRLVVALPARSVTTVAADVR
jgi:O-glycosyl hydrolase